MKLHVPPTTEALAAHYRAVRNRLWSPRNAVADPEAVSVRVEPVAIPEPPMWQAQAITFDQHVKDWLDAIGRKRADRHHEYILKRCAELGVCHTDVIGTKRTKRQAVVSAKQLIMFELRGMHTPPLSFNEIGRLLGGINHTTVVHAIQKMSEIMGVDAAGRISDRQRILADPLLMSAIRSDYTAGIALDRISEKHNVGRRGIEGVATIEGWDRPYIFRRPRRTGLRAKELIAAVRADIVSGMSVLDIAAKHTVTTRTIFRIKRDMLDEQAQREAA